MDENKPETWRDRIVAANERVEHAQLTRVAVWQQAREAGLTLAQIAEAAGVSASHIGGLTTDKARTATLDDPVAA